MKSILKRLETIEEKLGEGKVKTSIYAQYPSGKTEFLYDYKDDFERKIVVLVGNDYLISQGVINGQ